MTVRTICDACGMEYTWPGVTIGDRVYCCAACSQGLPCTCAAHGHLTTAPGDVVVINDATTVVEL